jgi:hypothetical protein
VLPNGPLLSKLIYQLAPAALVSAAGIVLLSSLAKPAFAPPPAVAPPLPTLKSEAVFTPTPRAAQPAPVQVAEQPALPPAVTRPAVKPKPQPHKLAAAELPLPPLRQQPIAAEPQPVAPPAAPSTNRTVMTRLRDATASVTTIPGRAYSRVAGWFAHEEPPRPPAEVPAADFNTTM